MRSSGLPPVSRFLLPLFRWPHFHAHDVKCHSFRSNVLPWRPRKRVRCQSAERTCSRRCGGCDCCSYAWWDGFTEALFVLLPQAGGTAAKAQGFSRESEGGRRVLTARAIASLAYGIAMRVLVPCCTSHRYPANLYSYIS